MNNLTATQVYSILRHLFSAFGGIVFFTKHESQMVNLAGLLVWAIPAIIGAWKARKDMKTKEQLATQVAVAEDEAAYLAHQATKKSNP